MTVDCFHWNNDSGFIKRFRVCWFGERHRERVRGVGGRKKKDRNEGEGERKGVKEEEVEVIEKEETVRQSKRRRGEGKEKEERREVSRSGDTDWNSFVSGSQPLTLLHQQDRVTHCLFDSF